MGTLLLYLLFPAGQPSFWKQVKLFLFDRTFENVYEPNAFDVAILTPYFLVLAVLSAYGLHRYWLVFRPLPAAAPAAIVTGYQKRKSNSVNGP